MRVLVTGASGFVGSALVKELRHGERAYEVHPLGRDDGDLADEGVADDALASFRPDVVVHAAARIGVVRCEEEPLLALRSNLLATVRVARACSGHGARLAYLSTADVYGVQAVADEETAPAPASLYALTKWWGEQAAQLYAPAGLLVLRLANPYGPGVDFAQGKGALPTMMQQAEQGERIPAFRGEAHAWCWIGDTTRAIRVILESGESGIFNVGTDADPIDCYPPGLLRRAAAYVNGKPNVLALCSFVDQDLDGNWRRFAMTVGSEPRLHAWDQDYDRLLREGWR